MAIKIFFCYAREDEPLLNKLKSHLRLLKVQGLIDFWYDREISAGTEWAQEIDTHLNEAQIILLLISSDFMDSEYINNVELKRAVERHNNGEACVIPIILRHVYWGGKPLGKLQALPTDGKPVISPYWHDLDEAFFDIEEGISKVVEKLTTKSLSNSQEILALTTQLAEPESHKDQPSKMDTVSEESRRIPAKVEQASSAPSLAQIVAAIEAFPDLVNQKLLNMHIGEKLDFFHEFSDEFYKPEFLPIAWQYLRDHPHRINGFMTENGIIYRASPFVPHWLSLILINGVVALGFLLIWLVGILHYDIQLPPVVVLFGGYIAVMAGGLFYRVLNVWKQYQVEPDHVKNILGNWVLWVHVRQVRIISGILTLWAGFIILLAIQQIENVGVAFLVGYIIESFVDLFLPLLTAPSSRYQNLPKSISQQVADVLAQSS